MVTKSRRKFIETLSGSGEIRRSGKHFANCTYRLLIEQEITISESLNDIKEIPGSEIYSGTVSINLEELLNPGIAPGIEPGEKFTLMLSDGRAYKTTFISVDNLFSGKYIVNLVPKNQ
jgi:hypothetical protein